MGLVEPKKPPYPYLLINNKAKLTIFYGQGGVMQEVYFPDRKAAEEAVQWIGHGIGRIPLHEIKDVT